MIFGKYVFVLQNIIGIKNLPSSRFPLTLGEDISPNFRCPEHLNFCQLLSLKALKDMEKSSGLHV